MLKLTRYALAFLAGVATAGLAGPSSAPNATTVETAEATRAAIDGEIEQTEQIFAYNVLSDVARRSVDAIRFLDAMLVGLLAAQAAVYAIYLDRSDRFADHTVRGMETAIAITLVALIPTIFSQEGPDPIVFRDGFSKDPGETRLEQIDKFIEGARRNGLLRFAKLVLFLLAMTLTVGDVVAARTTGPVAAQRAGAVQCGGKAP